MNTKVSLKTACQVASPQMVREALSGGFNVDGRLGQGMGPFHWLAESGGSTENTCRDIMDQLLAAGFDLSATDDLKRTPLYLAAFHGNTVLARQMIGAMKERVLESAFNTLTKQGSTVLHLCCDPEKGNSALAYDLIVAGADPMPHKQPGARQDSPMSLATSRGAFALCRLLYAFGADRDDGPTALQFMSRIEASVVYPQVMLRMLDERKGPLEPLLYERMCLDAGKQSDNTLALLQAWQARRSIATIASLPRPSSPA